MPAQGAISERCRGGYSDVVGEYDDISEVRRTEPGRFLPGQGDTVCFYPGNCFVMRRSCYARSWCTAGKWTSLLILIDLIHKSLHKVGCCCRAAALHFEYSVNRK